VAIKSYRIESRFAVMATPDVTVIALIQYFHTCKFADAFSHHLPQGHEN